MKLFSKRFSSNNDIENHNDNPYAGLASFEDPDKTQNPLLFCGRDNESYDVSILIKNNIFITLYGRSGIGKTSLLNAGVFPELREEYYFPIYLRLGIEDKQSKSYQSMVIDAIEKSLFRIECINTIDEQKDENAVDFLWNYFARHRFYNESNEEIIPVIVFDQFEELFRSNVKAVETLLRQLDYLNDKYHVIDDCEIDGKTYHHVTNYRFVVSIREDDLYKLEDSLDNCFLPALKRCRFRLKGLSKEGAKDAILMPCQKDEIFEKGQQEDIANTIIRLSTSSDGNINTLMLSLVCHILYEDSQRQNKAIKTSDIEKYKDTLNKYCLDIILKLPKNQREYIEDNLVDEHGRRKSVYLKDLEEKAPLAIGYTKNSNSRFLNVHNEQVELIHDQLASIIHENRNKRIEEQKTRSTVVSLFFYFILIAYFIWKILLRILHASWAYMPSYNSQNHIVDYIQEMLHQASFNMSIDNVRLLLLSKILGCIVLIYLITIVR